MRLSDEQAKSCACFNAGNRTGMKDWIEREPRTHHSNIDGGNRA